MSNGTSIASGSLPNELRTDISAERPSSLTCVSSYSPVRLESTGDLRTWLQQDFHASPFQSQESKPEKTTPEICGLPLSTSFAWYDPDTHSWRTFQACLLPDISHESWETWPKAGTIVDGEFYPQRKWERRIKEIVSGLLPTPLAKIIPETMDDLKRRQAAFQNGESKFNPTAKLEHIVGGIPAPESLEWMMGWPMGWTDLQPLATDKYQQWQQQHGDF